MAPMLAQGAFAIGKSSPDLFKRRLLWLILAVLIVMTLSYLSHARHTSFEEAAPVQVSRPHHEDEGTKSKQEEPEWTFVVGRDDLNFGLSDEQCDVSSPETSFDATFHKVRQTVLRDLLVFWICSCSL